LRGAAAWLAGRSGAPGDRAALVDQVDHGLPVRDAASDSASGFARWPAMKCSCSAAPGRARAVLAGAADPVLIANAPPRIAARPADHQLPVRRLDPAVRYMHRSFARGCRVAASYLRARTSSGSVELP
jgi:hypothetical protein